MEAELSEELSGSGRLLATGAVRGQRRAQFLIATHSPMLMAFPDARLLWFEEDRIEERACEAVEHVALMRGFLANPDASVREL